VTRNGRISRTPVGAREPDLPVDPPPAKITYAAAPGRAGATATELARLAEGLLVDPSAGQLRHQQAAVTVVLSWLVTFPGQDWHDRWLLSGSDVKGSSWRPEGLSRGQRGALTTGLGALVVLRAVRPSYGWLFGSRLLGVYDAYRRHNQGAVFAQFGQYLAGRGGNAEHDANALNVLTRMVIVTAKDVLDLDVADFTDYAAARKDNGRPKESLALAYQVLRAHDGMPGCPPTLAQYHHIGTRSPAQLVDRYPIVDRAIRDVLVHYLTERCAMLDYASLVNQSQMLAGLFWSDLERHHPGICSVNLPESVADAWKRRIRTLPDGRPRLNYHAVLLAVRAFYLDVRQWSLEDPARWAQWAAPCPIRQSDVHGYVKETRLRQARMQQRTRTLAPVLGQLVAAAEDRLRLAGLVVHAARATAPGKEFTVEATRYLRTGRAGPHSGSRAVFITTVDEPGPRVNAERDEDNAFWTWAAIEVLRRTGVRIEELLELTHLSLRRYQAPTGEMVPLLQISPSKTDRERVMPATPELVAVLARILRRVKTSDGQVPLLSRYDNYERTFCPPLPHLFQSVFQHRRKVISPGHVRKLLIGLAVNAGIVDTDGTALRFTPHDFRRIFATETVNGGLPIHIAAKLLGHLDLNTTQGYVAVYPQEVIHHYRRYVDQRRAGRPSEEYREPTDVEWREFRDHFSLRKVALGTCERPYGTPCEHEHACLRCPMLRMDPTQMPRLLDIEANTRKRLDEAHRMQWLGEVAALQEGLRHIAEKKQQAERLKQLADPAIGTDTLE
jgi:integrase